MAIVVACVLLFAAAGGLIASDEPREYRAVAFVIQVPSDLGDERGIALATSDRVLADAIALSGVRGLDADWLREHSSTQITSRLDLAFTVEAPRADDARALATAYARAFRAAIPDDQGLPVRGRGAGPAQGTLGPLGWALLGGFAGLGVGIALKLLRDGLRKGRVRPAAQRG